VIVDRFPQRTALLASDAAQGAAVTVMAILAATHRVSLLGLVLMALAFGLGDAVFFPASMAITPELVPGDQLVGASALNQTSTQLARVLIGPALGGVVVGLLGTAWGFGIDAASFAVSAVTLMTMRGGRARAGSGTGSPIAGFREGLRFLFSERWLWTTTLGASLGNFVAFSPLGALVPLLVRQVLDGDGIALGLILAVGGAAFVTYGLDAYGSVLFDPLIQEGVPAELLVGRLLAVLPQARGRGRDDRAHFGVARHRQKPFRYPSETINA
jgi:MFS family permease